MQHNGYARSIVWFDKDDTGSWCYKRQCKTMCDTEMWCYDAMASSGYVPKAERVEVEVIRTEYIEPQPVTDGAAYLDHFEKVLEALENAKVRHGDLTEYSVIPHGDRPYLIDWAESRHACDPMPGKREEPDAFWLWNTMEKQARGK
jgi:RIO-like serine/threonine protein kinase